MFKPLVVKQFQSVRYSCTADPFTGTLNYFYPASFFDENAYACGDWVNLLRLFHLQERVCAYGHYMTVSIGVTGVGVTFKDLAAEASPEASALKKPLFTQMDPSNMDSANY